MIYLPAALRHLVTSPSVPSLLFSTIFLSLCISFPIFGQAPLNGTYTIGGDAPNFASFQSALDTLNKQGVSGQVTFNLRPGIYEGTTFEIQNFTGNSCENIVTFQSEEGDQESTILKSEGILLKGVNGIRLKNISLQQVFCYQAGLIGSGQNECIELINIHAFPTVEQCAHHLRFDTLSKSLLSQNTIDGSVTIQLGESVDIQQNQIQNGGIRLTSSSNAAPSTIANNFIADGLALEGNQVNVYFNTVLTFFSSNALLLNNASNIKINNNIFATLSGFSAVRYINSSNVDMDYNCYFSGPGLVVEQREVGDFFSYALTEWTAATGNDSHSIFGYPQFFPRGKAPAITFTDENGFPLENFLYETDLHTNDVLVNGKGLPIDGFDIDIDGDSRATPFPDIGADESIEAVTYQKCPVIDASLSSQEAIDQFANLYAGCDSLSINLKITTNDKEVDLSNLNFIKHIAGRFEISDCNKLTNLNGLEQLTEIEGNLSISRNENLSTLEGLDKLTNIKDYFYLSSNPKLTSIEGLNALKSIGRDFYIVGLDTLKTLSGLEQIQYIGGFIIRGNTALDNIEAITQIDTIKNRIELSNNITLTDCSPICSLIDNNILANEQVLLTDNALGCKTLEEFTASCSEETCPSTTIILNTQTDVTIYGERFVECDTVFGDLIISDNFDGNNPVIDLSPLSFIKHIQGNLQIANNKQLISLNGFQNLLSINGSLSIQGNERLSALNGLDNLQKIAGILWLEGNPQLINLVGLSALDSIGSNLNIIQMNALQSLEGLEQLKTISRSINIRDNDTLTNIVALAGLTDVGEDLYLHDNEYLSDCQTVCNLIAQEIIRDNIRIYGNSFGCLSLQEVTSICNGDRCSDRDFTITSQEELIRFSDFYGACDTLNGSISIIENWNTSITDLSPLSFLKYIGKHLTIHSNTNLSSLDGLQYLMEIGGSLRISNNSLTSLEGLSSLTTIGGDLSISANDSLRILADLPQLSTVNGSIILTQNPVLENIDLLAQLTKIGGRLSIDRNPTLSDCSIICTLQEKEIIAGTISISNNGFGCTTLEETINFCEGINCPVGEFRINTQEALDDFIEVYGACDTLEGNLIITSNTFQGGTSISTLSGLNFLKYISGNLRIERNNQLLTLEGLQSLSSIGGDLYLHQNQQLTTLAALHNIDSVGRNLVIYEIDSLQTLMGLEQLVYIGNELQLVANESLENISALSNVQTIGTRVWINGNRQLSDCAILCPFVQELDQVSFFGTKVASRND